MATVNQIYATINTIVENMDGSTITTTIQDASDFVKVGGQVLSSASNVNAFYNSLCDVLSRTDVLAGRYQGKVRAKILDSFEFGVAYRRIRIDLPEAKLNKTWDAPSTSSSPYSTPQNATAKATLYVQDMPTYCYTDVIYTKQLESAFHNAMEMGAFISAIYTAHHNAEELSKEGMSMEADNFAIASVYTDTTNTNNARRNRNLLAEYNEKFNKTLTVATVLSDPEFFRYMAMEISQASKRIRNFSKLYNSGEIADLPDSISIEIGTDYAKAFEVYLQSGVFNKELVSLPEYSEIDYWQFQSKPNQIFCKGGSGVNAKIDNMVAFIKSDDYVFCTLDRVQKTTFADEWNKRSYIKSEADRRYCVDKDASAIIFYIADPITAQDED